jgi:hypothetical protein
MRGFAQNIGGVTSQSAQRANLTEAETHGHDDAMR